ncbi:MAG: glycosyl transferase [Pseudomonadota bacterium]|nr:glycosyl transferase [Pseudomonadota bacterium]
MTMTTSSPASGARLLSNGRFSTLITAAGSGYCELKDCALTRWQGDPVEDGDAYLVYLRDADSGAAWTLGAQFAQAGASYAAGRSDAGAWISCTHLGIEARLDIVVGADDDVELRSVSVRNLSDRARRIDITSYLEVVLNGRAAEASHPAFSKLFVQTEAVGDALLARRRPRGAGEDSVWMVHAVLGGTGAEHETDRKRFVGRGHSLAAPAAMAPGAALSGSAGNVLDPAMSLRRGVALDAGASAGIVFLLGAAHDREAALALARHAGSAEQITLGAAARQQALLQRLDISAAQAAYYEELAVSMLYGDTALRAGADVQRRAAGSANILGEYKVPASGALCVAIAAGPGDANVTTLLAAARYWEALAQPIHLLVVGGTEDWQERPAGVTLLDPARVPGADLDRILCLARAVVDGALPQFAPRQPRADASPARAPETPAAIATEALQFFNGNGGFSADGKEYVVRMPWNAASGHVRPPLPWTNVIANEQVGVLVSETGAGTTWSRNSREHRLTPWSNDPVRDPHGEAFYVRDEDNGQFWSPMPGPAPADAAYDTVHGFGYTTFRHASHELEHESTVFVPRHDPLKIVRIVLRNLSAHSRTLSLYSYQQLVLGSTPAETGRHVVTDAVDGALLATNRMAGPFADGVTIAAAIAPAASSQWHSADRASFIGAFGSPANPAALLQPALDGRSGAGLDPCAAFQLRLTIAPGASVECSFLLGETTSPGAALALVQRYRAPGAVEAALAKVRRFWRGTVGAIEVSTPVPAIDLMLNGWLAYQNLSCRIWGRSAFYQSGGAIGYRDQLQDASAMIYTHPGMTRRQICLHAAHQFVEGDVLHWWHPAPIEKGLRTRFSDDLLWLPYVAAFYIKTTGDWSVLDEVEGFLTAPLLEDGEDEVFLQPSPSGESADVYEHCCRALDRSLTKGAHGLPLMGTGDWNDGMNRVGREGRGESVWMGFFLFRIITDFLPACERRGDTARIASYSAYREHLSVTLNDAGWDGQWYRRAFYDNGAVMGSKDSDECQIDALAQAWSVISGAAPAERAQQALDAMEQHLVSDSDGLIRLLTPPFVDTLQDPGYIKGYVAGVRENGGQYTHAACWAIRAVAEAGRGERAAQLLEMLSPVSHALTPAAVATYQVEPYVIAADIYGADPHVGRGGWTWYTGSAGWMYRVALESVLGFTLQGGDSIRLKPVVPKGWPSFSIRYRLPDGATVYEVTVRHAGGAASATLDGQALPVVDGEALVPLHVDGAVHRVDMTLPAA